jgi:gluconokinase
MKPREWFLGIDLGTGSCKSVVLDPQARILGFGSMEYPAWDVESRWEEQDPESLLEAALNSAGKAVQDAGVEPGGCQGLSLGGALHSLLVLGRKDRPLSGVITWADNRAVKQALSARQEGKAQKLYQETGCPAHPMYPLYKILWLKENRPGLYQEAWRFVSAKEYVLWKLTGELVVDPSIASGSGLLQVQTLRWSPLALEIAGIGEARLSELCLPTELMGSLKEEAARKMKLLPGTPVILGSSDAVNSSLGAGAIKPSQATCMVGTSGALRVISPRPILDPHARTWCYGLDQEHWIVGGAINNGGVALAWMRDLLNQAFSLETTAGPISFEQILELAAQVGPGAGGVLCLPFFAGERSPGWNLNAKAAFLGLTLEHGLPHLARSLLEGVCFRFRSIQEVLGEIGLQVEEIVASGGFTKSSFWMQLMADILGMPLRVPAWGETSALGAALWALCAGQGAGPLEELGRLVRLGVSVQPDRERAGAYDLLYPMYKEAYRCLQPLFERMARAGEEPG